MQRIIQRSLRSTKIDEKIRIELNLPVATQRVQVLREILYLRDKKGLPAHALKMNHKIARVNWAKEMLEMDRYFSRTVVFTDRKKFNLFGPDGLDYYWHDLRKDHIYFSENKHKTKTMVWVLL